MDNLTDREMDSLRRLAAMPVLKTVIPPEHMDKLFDCGFLQVISGNLTLTGAARDRLSTLIEARRNRD